ncbi:MAG: hypothetical protein WKF54_10485, partial [Nocardioidaceae bacterium]
MPSPPRKNFTRSVACAAACLLALLASPVAQADPGDPVIPSQQAVDDAHQQVTDTQSSVASIEAQLAAANIALENLGIGALKAAEAYDGAVYHWQLADTAAADARTRAHRATATAAASRSSLAGYVVSHESAGSQLTTLSAAMHATGTTSLINQLADYNTTSAALDARLQQWRAATRLARVYQEQAARALASAASAKRAAEDAKQAAADAVAQQQSSVASIASQQSALISQLAAAENISVQLATQRAAGLERLRLERLAEARRLAVLEQQREQARQERLEQQRLEQQRLEQQRL